MKRDGEERTCKLCGKKEGVIKAVKYCSNRRRLWACEEGLIGGVLICVCLLFVIFRVIVYRICKMDE